MKLESKLGDLLWSLFKVTGIPQATTDLCGESFLPRTSRSGLPARILHVHVNLHVSLSMHENLDQREVMALRALYISTGGASWRKNAGWMKGEPCGSAPSFCGATLDGQGCGGWAGVLCNSREGHVRQLALQDNGLRGTLPTELGLLSHISGLLLSAGTNRMRLLSGTLPTELFQLPFVRGSAADELEPALLLDGHMLSGSIPAHYWGRLPEDMMHCRLPGSMGRCIYTSETPLSCFGLKRRRACGAALPPYGACPLLPLSRDSSPSDLDLLCEAVDSLGFHSGMRPRSSAVTLLLEANFTSLRRIASMHPALTAHRLQVAIPHQPQWLRRRSAAAAQMLYEHAARVRSWARVSSEPEEAVAARLRRCCAEAPSHPGRETHGGWPTRKMHPCCAGVLGLDAERRGVSLGGAAAFDAFVSKLLQRRPTIIIALGSSIATENHAGCHAAIASVQSCASRPGAGWLRMFGDWLNAAFPVSAAWGSAIGRKKHITYALGRTGSVR